MMKRENSRFACGFWRDDSQIIMEDTNIEELMQFHRTNENIEIIAKDVDKIRKQVLSKFVRVSGRHELLIIKIFSFDKQGSRHCWAQGKVHYSMVMRKSMLIP